jgi:hypothetical protein
MTVQQMKPSVFPSQAKEQAAFKADTEDMKLSLQKGFFFQVSRAQRTNLSLAALSMRSLWNARAKKQDRNRKEEEKEGVRNKKEEQQKTGED